MRSVGYTLAFTIAIALAGCAPAPEQPLGHAPVTTPLADSGSTPAPTTRPAMADQPSPPRPQVAAPPEVQPPLALAARAGANAQRIELTWRKSTPEPESYLVERSTDAVQFARVAILPGSAQIHVDTHSLIPQTTYTYRIKSWSSGRASAPSSTAQASTSTFCVFDGTLFLNKPNLAPQGIEPIFVAYEHRFFHAQTQEQRRSQDADPELTAQVAREAAQRKQMLVIDIECWPTSSRYYSQAVVRQSTERLARVVSWSKAAAPGLKVGVYGLPPLLYLPPAGTREQELALRREGRDLLMPVLSQVDFLAPSFYTFYADPQRWVDHVQGALALSRELGKPIYPFIWMNYHEGAAAELRNGPIAAEFWQLQLQTLRATADGVIIWGGYKRQWDPDAPWWQVTQQFLKPMQQQ